MTLSRTPWEASIPKWTNATRKPCVSLCACTACLLPRKASHKRHSSLWRPMRRFHGCTNRSLLSFLLLWHRLGRHEKLRFASEPTQRRSLVYALTPHCLLPRKASYKKYYSPGDLWGGGSMDAQIDLFLPSFFLSFCYDIVLDSIRSFNSQVDQRIEEALCLSLCSYTGCLFFQEKRHIRRRSSRISCQFPRSLPTPKSITAKMWCRTHSGSTTILLRRLPLINF